MTSAFTAGPTSTPPFLPLSEAVRQVVEPGMHLHFASTPSRSNAAVRAVARLFRGRDPRFTLSTSGFHSTAHLLGLLRLGQRYMGCFFGDNYPAPSPSPLYTALAAEGAALEHWSLLTYVTAFRAAALGQEWGVTGSLQGTTLGAELAGAGRFLKVPDPTRAGARIGLVRAVRPDVTFLHAVAADEQGHVLSSAPRGEGVWGALAARLGVIVTVERCVPGNVARRHPDLVLVPPHRIRAICVEPFGAHPQPLYAVPSLQEPGYRDDFDHYEFWRDLARCAAATGCVPDTLLGGDDDGGAGYRRFVGAVRSQAPASVPPAPEESSADPSAIDLMVVAAARQIARRVRLGGYRSALAGIGHGFLAARLARQHALEDGQEAPLLLFETGLYDLEAGGGNAFPLAWDNIAGAARLTDAEDVLGALACGAGNNCLAVLGAAQVDEQGNLNSTRLACGRWLVGAGGASDVAAAAAEVLVVIRAAPGRLVPCVDYVTSPGLKVRSIVTDLAVLEREAVGASWRVAALIRPPGLCVEDVLARLRQACPWPLIVPHPIVVAPPPTALEWRLLQGLDADGRGRSRESSRRGIDVGAV